MAIDYSWDDVSIDGVILPDIPKVERRASYLLCAPIRMTFTDFEQVRRWTMSLVEQPCTPIQCRDTCSPGEQLGPMLTGVCSA